MTAASMQRANPDLSSLAREILTDLSNAPEFVGGATLIKLKAWVGGPSITDELSAAVDDAVQELLLRRLVYRQSGRFFAGAKRAYSRISPKQKEMILALRAEGVPQSEIAQRLGVPLGTIKHVFTPRKKSGSALQRVGRGGRSA